MKLGVIAGLFVLFVVLSCGDDGRDFRSGSAGSTAQGGENSAGSGRDGGSAGEPLETVGGAGSGEPSGTVGGGGQGPIEPTPEGPGLGKLGDPCSEAGARACEGHAQGEQLRCEAGVWESNGSCPAGEHCDTREGANQGRCQPVLVDCEGQPTGAPICRDNNVELCNEDQVSTTLQAECTFCDSGSCTCPAGSYGVDASLSECRGCESGSFTAEPDLEECALWSDCEAGSRVSNTPSASQDRTCVACPAGKFTSGPNQSECLDANACPAGTIQTAAGTASTPPVCDDCEAGTYCAGGTAAAAPCAAGTWDHDGSPATACVDKTTCNAGQYISSAGAATTNRTCSSCASGRFSTGTNASSCTACATCSAAAGTYESAACSATTNRVCTAFPSCQGPAMTANCGASSNDGCCKSPTVTGTAAGVPFYRGTDTTYPATISTFALDKYEVTVGRFRNFVEAYKNRPAPGAGAHPLIANSGWQVAWNSSIANDSVALANAVQCHASYQSWHTDGSTDHLPMNCVNWFEAFAFCAWDGGRLPTEAEWEYAAAGGPLELTYPWGNTPVPTGGSISPHANFNCQGDGDLNFVCTFADILPVGYKTAGVGEYGQLDLSGSMWEWTLDWWNDYTLSCNNCASITTGSGRVIRGGSWDYDASYLRAWYRPYSVPPGSHRRENGFRCARTP